MHQNDIFYIYFIIFDKVCYLYLVVMQLNNYMDTNFMNNEPSNLVFELISL
jgi:hypothetical protein